ncbi:unnamed protein product [Lymnaea stagnalis]|uniref:Major facilitator superfamily (MFS) profile domain-containing protein n=1 Tax=Lymnaea stagnalis TaxID=6523 RepID=A0AAV2IGQ0_LYMST
MNLLLRIAIMAKASYDRSYIRNISYVLYLSGFLDFFGVSMVVPLILPQARELGASSTFAGILGSVYGGIQLLSSPVIGKWSDHVSRRFSLMVCLFISSLGYASLGIYSSLAVLFLGRFVSGCFKHSQTISKALIADIVANDRLSAVLGNFNSFSSIGFVIGPIVGGHLAESSGGFMLVALVASSSFILNTGIIWWSIPKDTDLDLDHQNKLDVIEDSHILINSDFDFSFKRFFKSFKEFDWTELWDLFLIKFLAGFSVIIYRTNFTLVLKEKFDASPKTVGYMTSYSGVVATLSGFVLGYITKRFSNQAQLFLTVTTLQVLTLMCLTMSTSVIQLVVFLTPLSLVTCVSRVSSTTLTISRCGSSSVGSVMGLSQSVMAVARMLAPFLAGVAQEFSVDGAEYISILAATASVVLMLWRPQNPSHRNKKKTNGWCQHGKIRESCTWSS